MRRSRNEIVSLVVKAGRGCEFDPGSANDIGRAAGWLCAHGFDGVEVALDALKQKPSDPKCMVRLTTSTIDLLVAGFERSWTLEGAETPILVLGLCGVASQEYDVAFSLGNWAVVANGRLYANADISNPPKDFDVQLSERTEDLGNALPVQETLTVQEDIWNRANVLAARTYVPATSSSRAGAGADINDND